MKLFFLICFALWFRIDSALAQKEENAPIDSDHHARRPRPLVIIDGVVYDSIFDWVPAISKNRIWLRDASRSMFSIPGNPDDIEAFTILKNDTAVSLYGDKAKNGVLIITTKKDKTSKIQKE